MGISRALSLPHRPSSAGTLRFISLSSALALGSFVAVGYYLVATQWNTLELLRAPVGLAALWGPATALIYILLRTQVPDTLTRFTLSAIGSYALTTLAYFGAGVLGMPPPEPGRHPTQPPRVWGGNIDCNLLLAGTTLFLPISVDGALFSAGDGHARQGDGEVSQLAIECPLERVELTLDVRDDLRLSTPIAWTPEAWITLGFDEDLDEAAALALDAMLELMSREHGLERRDALALATAAVDLHVTQLVNVARGVHAVLRHDAIRWPTS